MPAPMTMVSKSRPGAAAARQGRADGVGIDGIVHDGPPPTDVGNRYTPRDIEPAKGVVRMTRFRTFAIAVLAPLVLLGALAGPAAAQQKKMAMILPGPVEDADFNALGYGALQAVGKTYGLAVSHSEKVAVADAERVAREYLGSGYSIVAFHGGQYLTMVQKLAVQFPDANFIIVSQGQGLPGNVWNINRHFHEGFYPLGVLAALATKSNKIAFI